MGEGNLELQKKKNRRERKTRGLLGTTGQLRKRKRRGTTLKAERKRPWERDVQRQSEKDAKLQVDHGEGPKEEKRA